jgi:hypothetical protein
MFERAHDFHVNSLVVNEPPSVNALESQSIYLVVLYFNIWLTLVATSRAQGAHRTRSIA